MDNREKLLEAALDLFSRKGYDAVGVMEVVKSCGVTKPTLYHYFGSKEGLLGALLKRDFTPFLQDLRSVARYPGEVLEGLTAITRLFFSFAEKKPAFYGMQHFMSVMPVDNESGRLLLPYYTEQMVLLENFFREAAKDHGNMAGRHKTYALTFFGMLNTYIAYGRFNRIKLDEALISQALHQFMHGIFS